MTKEEFEEIVVGLELDIGELGGEVDVEGPWNPRYLLDLRLEVDGRKIGAHVEFVLEEHDEDEMDEFGDGIEIVQSLESLTVYDLAGLEDDAEIDEGEELPQEGEFFESVLDEISDNLGCDYFGYLADKNMDED